MLFAQFSVKAPAMVTFSPQRRKRRRNLHPDFNKLKIKNTSVAQEESAGKVANKLPSELQKEKMPKHVAITIDGHSKWARSRGRPLSESHYAGYNALNDTIRLSCDWGIKAVTFFTFSTENCQRPKAEIDSLLTFFEKFLKEKLMDFQKDGVRLNIIGDTTQLPASIQELTKEAMETTKNNSKLDLGMAVIYSGRFDIVQACQRVAEKVKGGTLEPEDITESVFEEELQASCISKYRTPDLMIRTSGELRLSDFLLWQSSYSELYFADVLWPDFKEADYIQALASFQRRQRRFGRRI